MVTKLLHEQFETEMFVVITLSDEQFETEKFVVTTLLDERVETERFRSKWLSQGLWSQYC